MMPVSGRVSRMAACWSMAAPYQSLVPPPRMRSGVACFAASRICWRRASICCTAAFNYMRLETGQAGKRQHTARDAHLAEFGAAVQGRNGLVRIEQEGHIEGALDGKKGIEFGTGELHAHRIDFFLADAVFTGDGAADFDAQGENGGAKGFGAIEFTGLVGVEQDQRMQIA